jgi:hypothetical protein
VFIGIGMDRQWITAAFDDCLVPEDRFEPARWTDLADPFPAWGVEARAA